jgi:DNA polymerase delta subunit 1
MITLQVHDIQLFDQHYLVFGRDNVGKSVCIRTFHKFHFYIKPRDKKNYKHLNDVISALNEILVKALNNYQECKSYQCSCNDSNSITSYGADMVTLCKKKNIDYKTPLIWFDNLKTFKSMVGYQKVPSQFAKICLEHYGLKTFIKNELFSDHIFDKYEIFEFDIDPVMRFMADLNIVGFGFISIDDVHLKKIPSKRKITRCCYEYELETSINIRSLDQTNNFPINLLSFDIECISLVPNKFPNPEDDDPVITIGLVLERLFDGDKCIQNVIFCLENTNPVDNACVRCFLTEEDLLHEFFEFFLKNEVDILAGYNSNQFDIPYLLKRAKKLGLKDFVFLSKLRERPIYFWQQKFQSAQAGTRMTTQYNTPGVVFFDVFSFVKKTISLQSYTLNNVAKALLQNEKKDDMNYKDLAPFFKSGPAKRAIIAKYCLQDTVLVSKLIDIQKMIVNNIELSKLCGVLFNHSVEKGISYKILRKILEYTIKEGFVVPNYQRDCNGNNVVGYYDHIDNSLAEYIETDTMKSNNKITQYFDVDDKKKRSNKRKFAEASKQLRFQGAFVLDPEVGFHEDTIVTLDFASLYPSEMRMHNMCTTTLLKSIEHAKQIGLNDNEYKVVSSGFVFVQKNKFEGILPKIETELFNARKQAKQQLKEAYRKNKYVLADVFNGKQLAIKLIMNSIYGFCGSRTAPMAALPVATSITCQGRTDIIRTKNWVEANFKKLFPESKATAKVVYGDSDSVFVKFIGVNDVIRAETYGKKIEKVINSIEQGGLFELPMYLEFEKIYYPFFLLKKKKYIGLKYDIGNSVGKIDYKGVEIARRDWSIICTETQKQFIKMLVIENKKTEAIEYVKKRVVDLVEGNIPNNAFVLSKKISKFNYKIAQPHMNVLKMLEKVDPLTAPKLGDRIEYFIGQNEFKKIALKAYPLSYFDKVPIDRDYYLQKQLKGPLIRLLEPILGKEDSLEIFSHKKSKKTKNEETSLAMKRLFKTKT